MLGLHVSFVCLSITKTRPYPLYICWWCIQVGHTFSFWWRLSNDTMSWLWPYTTFIDGVGNYHFYAPSIKWPGHIVLPLSILSSWLSLCLLQMHIFSSYLKNVHVLVNIVEHLYWAKGITRSNANLVLTGWVMLLGLQKSETTQFALIISLGLWYLCPLPLLGILLCTCRCI